MSRIDLLLQNYSKHVRTPWQTDAAAMQRVWFCIYDPHDELNLRTKLGEFELATLQSSKKWAQYDLTDSFAEWLAGHKYAEKYFKNPSLLNTVLPDYKSYLVNTISQCIEASHADGNTVLALYGVGSLFGFIKVKELVEKVAPLVPGRLVVFFPGTHENNTYRLLDGYEGWGYLAVPITSDKEL